MSLRATPPGPSFLREHEVRIRERNMRAGMGRPSDLDGGWWVAPFWVADESGVITFRDLAPLGGPPPGPPAARVGPSLAGSLSGMILEDGDRLQLKVAPASPPADPARPWEAPAVLLVGIRFEPARVATMSVNELADTVLGAFRRSVEALSKP